VEDDGHVNGNHWKRQAASEFPIHAVEIRENITQVPHEVTHLTLFMELDRFLNGSPSVLQGASTLVAFIGTGFRREFSQVFDAKPKRWSQGA
jgi:hypothetical protein